jgi:hypothetical protein
VVAFPGELVVCARADKLKGGMPMLRAINPALKILVRLFLIFYSCYFSLVTHAPPYRLPQSSKSTLGYKILFLRFLLGVHKLLLSSWKARIGLIFNIRLDIDIGLKSSNSLENFSFFKFPH